MPIFRCEQCGCVENTAASNFWEGSRLCSQCDPDIGRWHGLFTKRPADDGHEDDPERPGFLREKR